jgi:hypothetical protein
MQGKALILLAAASVFPVAAPARYVGIQPE